MKKIINNEINEKIITCYFLKLNTTFLLGNFIKFIFKKLWALPIKYYNRLFIKIFNHVIYLY